MKTRTKVIGLLAAAGLLVAGTIFGTIAYLTDSQEVKNTFTVGDVDITLDETNVNDPDDPDGRTEDGNTYDDILPGHEYTKDPKVTIKAGSKESYIRAKVTFTKVTGLEAIVGDAEGGLLSILGEKSTDWTVYGTPVDDTANNTRTYEFRYKAAVGAGETDVSLPEIFKKVTIPAAATNAQLKEIDNMQITVVAQAIQADGFDDAAAAWTAFDAPATPDN